MSDRRPIDPRAALEALAMQTDFLERMAEKAHHARDDAVTISGWLLDQVLAESRRRLRREPFALIADPSLPPGYFHLAPPRAEEEGVRTRP